VIERGEEERRRRLLTLLDDASADSGE
jgi:hypothetical protein